MQSKSYRVLVQSKILEEKIEIQLAHFHPSRWLFFNFYTHQPNPQIR